MNNQTLEIASLSWSTELLRQLEPGSGTTAVENLVSRLLRGELEPDEMDIQGTWTWVCVELPLESLQSGAEELLIVESIVDPDDQGLHVQVRLGAEGCEPMFDGNYAGTVSQ